MGAELFPAERVHDQQARTLRGCQAEDVLRLRRFGIKGREHRR